MDSGKYKSSGYNASLPARLQVDNTIRLMQDMKGGNDIRQWSGTTRRELELSEQVDIVNDNGDFIATAPKLALVVVSSVFRDHFNNTPEAKFVKIDPSLDDSAVAFLAAWVKAIVRSTGKFGVGLPPLNTDLIKVRHAAHFLGMELYVRHFQKAYKDDLRNRTPPMEECVLLERCVVGPVDDMMTGLGERLAYLRRRGDFDAGSIAKLAEFLQGHPVIAQAVYDADVRAAKARKP